MKRLHELQIGTEILQDHVGPRISQAKVLRNHTILACRRNSVATSSKKVDSRSPERAIADHESQLTNLQARASSQAASNAYHLSVESQRKARALAEIDGDRDVVKNRVDKERMSRQYREEAARLRAEQAEHDAQEAETAQPSGEAGGQADDGGKVQDQSLINVDHDEDQEEDDEYDAFPQGGQKLGGT